MKKIIVKATVLSSLLIVLFGACSKAKNATPKNETINQTSTFDFRTDKSLQEAPANTANTLAKENDDDDDENGSNDVVDMAKINAIYALTPSSLRRQAFNLLKAKEKVTFWDNLTSVKINNSGLTNSQKDLLEDFTELFLKKKFFKPNGENLRNAFENNQLQIKLQLNNAGITDLMFYNIFMSGKFTPYNPQPQDVIIGGDFPSCGCRVNSGFNFYNFGSSCSSSSSGCGLLWALGCNGRSYITQVGGAQLFLDDV